MARAGFKVGLTKKLTETGIISTAAKPAVVRAITLCSGTDISSIIIKNNGTSGTEMWKLTTVGTTAAGDSSVSISFGDEGIICTTDAYGTLAGTNAVAYILYDEAL